MNDISLEEKNRRIELIDAALSKNSTERDKALLTLSSAAIVLGLTQFNQLVQFQSHQTIFKFSIILFAFCIFSVLYSFRRTDSVLKSQCKVIYSPDELKNDAINEVKIHNKWNDRYNNLAFTSFFGGICFWILCFL